MTKRLEVKKRKSTGKNKRSEDWINNTEFWKVFGWKFLRTLDRQMTEYKVTNDRKVLSDSFWTTDERKIMAIYDQVTAVLNHLKDILNTIKYLKVRGLKMFLKKNNLDENEYLRFIYENHQIRVSSTPDVCARLADIVYATGISEKRFNWHKFVTHDKIKSLPCAKILLEFIDSTDHLRMQRHKIIHFGGHKNEIMESIEAATIDRKYLKESPILLEHFRETRGKEIMKLERDMKGNYRACLKFTKLFLNSMVAELKVHNKNDESN